MFQGNPYFDAPSFGGPADPWWTANADYMAAAQNAQNQGFAAQNAALNAAQAGAYGMVPPGFGWPGYGYGGDCGPSGLGMGPGCGPCGGYPGYPGYPGFPGMLPGVPGFGGPLEALALATKLSPDQLYRLGFGQCNIRDTARGRSALFGWDSGANCNPDIQPGATVTLTNTAQSNFLIKGIDLTNNMAERFVASSIKVGNTELLLTTGNISLAIFKSDSCFKDLKACVASPGVEISITVTNIDTVARRFVATIVAEELPPGRCP